MKSASALGIRFEVTSTSGLKPLAIVSTYGGGPVYLTSGQLRELGRLANETAEELEEPDSTTMKAAKVAARTPHAKPLKLCRTEPKSPAPRSKK